MAATLYDPAFATASKWFTRRRMQALTAITLMAGFASTIFIPLAGWLVYTQGWRAALVTLAVILGLGTIAPHAVLLRHPPDSRAQHPHSPVRVGEAVRHTSFRWLTAAFWLATFATAAVGIHLLPYLTDRGYDPAFAAAAVGALGATQVLARLVIAPVGNRVSPRVLAAVVLGLQPLSLMLLLLVRSTLGVLLFVVLFGAQRGLSTLARPTLLGDLYGAARFASIAGVLQFSLSLAQAAGPYGVGALYDGLQTYEPIFWALALISAVAALLILPVGRGGPETLKSVP
jgi:predicted MFS family arabinose efflux permease